MGQITVNVGNGDGNATPLPVTTGGSLMEALRVEGLVEAMCGGQAACATCHVFIAPDWLEQTGTPDSQELDLLDSSLERRPNSRLSCQIIATPELDGLELIVAPPEG